jgi:FkbM family methyltransferase
MPLHATHPTRLHALADRLQRLAARSPALVRLAVLVRNQARCVIKYHLAESPDVNESGEVWLRGALAPRVKTAMDIGANVGDWLEVLLALKAREPFAAIAIEPSASALAHLRERFAQRFSVTIREAAAGDRLGTLDLLEEPDAGKGSTLVPGLGRVQGSVRRVAVTTVDEELRRSGWPGIDLLKIDAEGYDARVLRGASEALRAQRIGVVQFEYHRSWQLAGDTLYGARAFLESFGYRVYLLKRDGLYELNYPRYEEYFEYSNFVAIAPAWEAELASYLRGTI